MSHADWFPPGKRFPQPDWAAIARWVESSSASDDDEEEEIWAKIADRWVEALADSLGESYGTARSPHFVLVSRVSARKADELLGFLEDCLRDILGALPFLGDAGPKGICPVLVVENTQTFYQYVSEFLDEGKGEFGAFGGVYLSRGYGHFVVPGPSLDHYIDVFSHELCHACLADLDLPTWLDEAITMTIENSVSGRNPYVLDRETVSRHQDYWTEASIRGFWRGDAFRYADDGQELSYHLAQFLLSAIYQGGHTPSDLLNAFIVAANRADAGVSAAREILDMDLPAVLEKLLGEGDWEPETAERFRSSSARGRTGASGMPRRGANSAC